MDALVYGSISYFILLNICNICTLNVGILHENFLFQIKGMKTSYFKINAMWIVEIRTALGDLSPATNKHKNTKILLKIVYLLILYLLLLYLLFYKFCLL